MPRVVHASNPGISRVRGAAIALIVITAACSASTRPAPKSGAAESKRERAASERPAAAKRERKPRAARRAETQPPANGTTEQARESEKPSACPANMQLVEGEYCTRVEHKCLKSWYDKSNKKTVCEKFDTVARCVGDKVKKRFCIDRYEWPNAKGERAEVMNRFHQAQVKCAAVGKRMCTESEWTMSCEGPEMKPFPYGYVRDTNKCHGDMMWDDPDMPKVAKRDAEELARLWRGVRSGQPECVSDYGVYDTVGNADEVVASETSDGTWRAKFDSVHTGGPWYKGVRNQCRPKIYTHEESFYYYFLSFRCCAEPDGEETDPRTPRQIKDKWKIEKVEKLAGFTIEEMKHKLELKSEGKCECKPRDILCKTMCGTLLGPNAKDAR